MKFLIFILALIFLFTASAYADETNNTYFQLLNLDVQADSSIYIPKGTGKITERKMGDEDLSKFYDIIKSDLNAHNVGINPNSNIHLIVTVTDVKKVPQFSFGISAEKSFIKAKIVLLKGEKVIITDSVYGESSSSTPIIRTNNPFEGAMKEASAEIMRKVLPIIIPGFPSK
ncbi:hypothetical protein Thena_1312 [Thermodesulfobium narugense DSM 14796]|uniref:Lipoprotein n=1 Tax=Thermodesulfobium narugense DSM 14796 TaxID=747365 RepID=M1E977_9BACT|nr:hypothetical protein [Thermodesulfobium narugense]AEE14929.1 hypothetical protein Thena_1312 [Thermodesulfobium narugense DSM 14796]